MDEFKEFELLPDHEKRKIMKFYKIFTSAVPETQVDEGVENVPQKSASKQKTLDGWLLKFKGTTGDNSNSGAKTPEKIRENIASKSVSEKNSQDAVKSSDLEVSSFRQENNNKHSEIPGSISNTVSMNSKDQLIPNENVQSVTEKDSLCAEKNSYLNHSEFKHDKKLKHSFVPLRRLDFTDFENINSYFSTACSSDLIKNSNDELSQQISSSNPDVESSKTPVPSSSNDRNFDNVERSSLEVDTPGDSSCNEKNREAYHKLKKLCLNHELDLDDIFQKPEFKEMIEKYKSLPESIVFIGSHKSVTTGKVEPTVNVHKSKKKLLEALSVLKTRNN